MPAIDFGGAIAQGITGYINGMRTGMSDTMDRQAKQQALTIQADQAAQATESHDSAMSQQAEQLKQLQMQTKQMQDSMSKQTVYQAFDSPTPMTSINAALKDPNISKLFNVGRIADIDQKDVQQVTQAKAITDAGGHPVQTFSTDPTTNQPVANVVDLNKIKIQTGYATYAAQRDAELAKNKALTSTSNQANVQALTETDGLLKGAKETDPAAGAKDSLNSYLIAHPEAQIKLLAKGSSGSETLLAQMERAFTTEYSIKGLKPSPQQVSDFYHSFLAKETLGTGYIAKQQEVQNVTGAQIKSQANLNSGNTNPADLRMQENKIFANMPPEQVALYKPQITELKANKGVITGIDRVLSTADSTIKPVSKNLISDAETWIKLKFGANSAEAFNNVNFNTKAGMLLTNYIKSLSGLTVSDKERAGLTDIILGGQHNDLKYMKRAMQSFREELVAHNNSLADSVKEIAPYTASTSTDYSQPPVIPHPPSNTGSNNTPHHTKQLPPLDLAKYKH
jgi:hypothetical protein